MKVPDQFREKLTRVGGLNRYGEPNFIIVWGKSYTVRRGGTWAQDDGTFFKGYRDVVEDGRPCWVLKQWKPPEVYGSSTMYFMENREESTGLQILGDYPWRGQYETVQPFVWRGLVNGKMVVEHMPLNSMILDMVVPIILRCQDANLLQRRAALDALEEKKQASMLSTIEAKRLDAKMAFTGPVSYSKQGCKTSIVDRKMYDIQKSWNQAMNNFRGRGLGISLA